MSQRPVVVGLNACKDVVDKSTGHVTLVNRVHKLRVSGFPARAENYTVVCALADGDGETMFTLEVRDLSQAARLHFRRLRIRMTKGLGEQCLLVTIRDLVFPRPGRYEFLLLADTDWFASSAITILGPGE